LRLSLLCLLPAVLAVFATAAPGPADPAHAALSAYAGSWKVTKKEAPPGAKPEELKNQCASIGKYFVCEQTVNGQTGTLLVFIPTSRPGHFYIQNISADGRASSRGDLEVTATQWTFSNTWNQGGRTTYYRTVNTFTGKNQIHFEQSESTDNKNWKVTGSGDETRITAARK
jgi:hypothetical protein